MHAIRGGRGTMSIYRQLSHLITCYLHLSITFVITTFIRVNLLPVHDIVCSWRKISDVTCCGAAMCVLLVRTRPYFQTICCTNYREYIYASELSLARSQYKTFFIELVKEGVDQRSSRWNLRVTSNNCRARHRQNFPVVAL